MYCSSCGNQIPEDARFCEKCGTPVIHITENKQGQPENTGSSNTSNENEKSEHSDKEWASAGAEVFQKFTDNVRGVADDLGLDKYQRISGIIASCALLFFVICITGTLISWLTVISGILLLVFCLKKKKVDSMELAVAMTVFMMRFAIVDIRVLFGEDIYYSISTIIMRIVMYALIVIYWLVITDQIQRNESGMAWVLILSSVTTVYSVFDTFMSFSFGFRSVLFSMGRAGFFACYAILISRDQKTMDYIRRISGLRLSGVGQASGQAEAKPESPGTGLQIQPESSIRPEPPVQSETVIQPEPPVHLETVTQPESIEQSETVNQSESSAMMEPGEETVDIEKNVRPIFCLSCGNRLSSDAAFCEHCGAKVDIAVQGKVNDR